MKFVLLLSLIALLSLSGCQRDKMNSKNLTSVNVKRDLPAISVDTVTPTQTLTQVSTPEVEKTLPPQTPTVTNKKPATSTKSYHIIIASHPRESLAQEDVARLRAKGYNNAQIITKDQRYRVSIANDPDKQKATKMRDELALRLNQDDIWIILY